jgi:hypothetical protein
MPTICFVPGCGKLSALTTINSPSTALLERTHLRANRLIFFGIAWR